MFNFPKRNEMKPKAPGKPAFYGDACQEVAWTEESEKSLKRGLLEGKPVQVLIDTGCSRTMVSSDCVKA